MAKWDVEVVQPFTCARDEAKQRVIALLDDFRAKNGALVKDIRWNAAGDQAIADGSGFEGEFSLEDGRVVAGIKLGFALKLMKGKVESELKKRLATALA